jgi:hypothetical protein
MKAECKNVEKFVFLMFKKNKLGEVHILYLFLGHYATGCTNCMGFEIMFHSWRYL